MNRFSNTINPLVGYILIAIAASVLLYMVYLSKKAVDHLDNVVSAQEVNAL
jgi:hypothetical protein